MFPGSSLLWHPSRAPQAPPQQGDSGRLGRPPPARQEEHRAPPRGWACPHLPSHACPRASGAEGRVRHTSGVWQQVFAFPSPLFSDALWDLLLAQCFFSHSQLLLPLITEATGIKRYTIPRSEHFYESILRSEGVLTETKLKWYFITKETVRFISGIMGSLKNCFLEKHEFKINKPDLCKRFTGRTRLP